MICASLAGPNLLAQIQEAEKYADLIEVRCDLLPDLSLLMELRSAITRPLILTHRLANQQIWNTLFQLRPAYVDLEWNQNIQVPPSIAQIHSSHTVLNLEESFKQMGGEYQKLAISPNTMSEVLDALEWVKEKKNVILSVMGKHAVPGRVLAAKIGVPWVYGYVGQPTATGQPSVKELRELYQLHTVSASTHIYGLIGSPVSQSVGHLYHNAYLPEINGRYLKFDLEAWEVSQFIERMHAFDLKGLSVTAPYKQAFFETPINTLSFMHGRMEGINTDGMAARQLLKNCDSVGIIGRGGAAQGIKQALETEVVLLKRGEANHFDVLINATPSDDPLPLEKMGRPKIVLDLKVAKKETDFIKKGKKLGAEVIDGLTFFKTQAEFQKHYFLRAASTIV